LSLLLLGSFQGQQTVRPTVFPLYRMERSCLCINTKKQTPTLRATEITAGDSVFQVFHSRRGQGREMFRIKIGNATGPMADKWWNYGIADEADFNGDGVPDYSWYGGDDIGFAMYLFLSSGSGYEQVDVIKTVEDAWREKFHASPPDLGEAGGDYGVSRLQLERSASGLALMATVANVSAEDNNKRTYQFRIAETGFRK